MDDGNQNNQNPTGDTSQNTANDDISMLDKFIQNNPFVKNNPANYQNVQTQSMIKSSREEAKAQLAAINAQNAEILRQQKRAEEATKAKRTGIYIGLGVMFAAIIGVGIWIMINALGITGGGIASSGNTAGNTETERGKVGSYQCTSEKCNKVCDITKETVLIRDGVHYYLYNKDSKQSTLTTIPENEYHEIKPFTWSEKSYLIIDPESAQSAIFSITDNRQVTEFAYDEFYTDANDAVYKDMDWIKSNYIFAKSGGYYRLIQISNGKEIVHAVKGIFAYDKYYFGYENDNSIHVYNSNSAQIYVAKSDVTLFVSNGKLIIFNKEGDYTIMQQDGTEPEGDSMYDYLNDIEREKRINKVDANGSYYRIPAER